MNTNKKESMRIGFALVWGALILLLFTCIRCYGIQHTDAEQSYGADTPMMESTPEAADFTEKAPGISLGYTEVSEASDLSTYTERKETDVTSVGDKTCLALLIEICQSYDDSRYNSEELTWLSAIINAEARGEPFEGKLAVGAVVMNRVRSSLYPNSIKEVIFDKKYGIQFSPTEDGSIYLTPTEESIIAAKLCLEGYLTDPDILFFYDPNLSSSTYFRNERTFEFRIGNHEFYS